MLPLCWPACAVLAAPGETLPPRHHLRQGAPSASAGSQVDLPAQQRDLTLQAVYAFSSPLSSDIPVLTLPITSPGDAAVHGIEYKATKQCIMSGALLSV